MTHIGLHRLMNATHCENIFIWNTYFHIFISFFAHVSSSLQFAWWRNVTALEETGAKIHCCGKKTQLLTFFPRSHIMSYIPAVTRRHYGVSLLFTHSLFHHSVDPSVLPHFFFFPLSADSFVTVTQVHCGQTEGEKIDTLTPRTGLKISATAKEIESSLFLNSSWFERDKLICHEKDTFCSSRLRFNTWNCKDGEILRVLVLSPISAGDYTSELQWFSH